MPRTSKRPVASRAKSSEAQVSILFTVKTQTHSARSEDGIANPSQLEATQLPEAKITAGGILRTEAQKDRLLERLDVLKVDDKARKIQQLSEELQSVKSDYDAVFDKYRAAYHADKFFRAFPASFLSSSGRTWGRELREICSEASDVVYNFGYRDIEDMDQFSKDDKDHFIASLDGFLIQEDYDYIVPLKSFYSNPFWYIGPDPAAAMHDAHGAQSQRDFANGLHTMGKSFQKANPELYELWRVTTCRVANVYDIPERGLDFSFGESTAKARETLIGDMVSSILKQKTCQLLLKQPLQIQPGKGVHRELLRLYMRASQNAINMSFWDVEPDIYLLDRQDPTFQRSSASTQAATEHFLETEDSHLDDKRIIGLTIPGLRTRSVEREYGVIRKLVEIDEWRLKAHALKIV
ncbi:uncharacterized protein BDV14DRAFT_204323 [Aspergillus stella-maris]|uniref:uncharacterized protein n=1 Tax=Aspergillus stella-maris TaxID=1810926 RepID=UPI003CCD7C7D